MGFTERDIKILRQADAIEFHDDGTMHEVVATIRDRVSDEEARHDYEHRIAVHGFVMVFWYSGRDTDDVRSTTMTSARAFATSEARGMATVPGGTAAHTWINLLQAGDELVLLWSANNTPRELRRMGLVHDELHLSVFREQREWYRFYLAARVSRADAGDRMIRLALDW